MRYLIGSFMVLLLALPAHATTYSYQGQPFTQGVGSCAFASQCTSISGTVTFLEDTTHFTGTLSLSLGDTASFHEGVPYPFPFDPLGSVTFPGRTFSSLSTVYATSLGGTFTFDDGAIIDWRVQGGTSVTGCGLGPGCASANSSFLTTPTLDASVFFFGNISPFVSNNGGGEWSELNHIEAVPESSTWVMLLIGFAGGGFVTHRRRKPTAEKAICAS
jgi:hypothetical protein